ncbi:MAG: hypothetical protein K1X38_01935 [Microthrixaceae bacterium]|nr:hypothetical protein [Microthrixaceae bacterium]
MPSTINDIEPAEVVAGIASQLGSVSESMTAVYEMLCQRPVLLAIALEPELVDDADQAVRDATRLMVDVSDRLAQVKTLASEIDRLADPLLIGRVQ